MFAGTFLLFRFCFTESITTFDQANLFPFAVSHLQHALQYNEQRVIPVQTM